MSISGIDASNNGFEAWNTEFVPWNSTIVAGNPEAETCFSVSAMGRAGFERTGTAPWHERETVAEKSSDDKCLSTHSIPVLPAAAPIRGLHAGRDPEAVSLYRVRYG
uniref:Uncharacterized protein n=1 Tax=Candidatus Kentrum eta TaxID=2126337 RepID=A0A450VT50_9GAMM|nr:MAG: hypothetical protein BECKH772B_GA0070898_104841 [Candidatus Kentron sp. H]VFK04928.1 MAG: hypothetical protein BECKH772A_GA0070896_104801 [Candidatus Kentron sp. H]VFK07968.1 MAG: hypothetical protein BECKH772C_GA0070978_104741 [Candidatus Kentron sp. H]